jgi:hypothetical protein
MPTTSTAVVLDRAELAWAAGFFDGEGSTIARSLKSRPGYHQLNVTVPQSGRDGVPPVLLRFQRVMFGMGHINGPSNDGIYMLRYLAREEARLVLDLMWPHLGDIKRAQATRAIELVEQQYASGAYRRRPARRRRPEPPTVRDRTVSDLERAWAAGFLDAEGCFGLARAGARRKGPDWYRIRVSASQHGAVGSPAAVLLKLQSVFGGLGRIECHGEPDDFRWCAEGLESIERVLEITRPWLGDEKSADAAAALAAFRSQVRLKGDSVRCVRGHEYSYTAMRGGRMRRICNACARLQDRRERARQGIPPRAFKNIARRYTE